MTNEQRAEMHNLLDKVIDINELLPANKYVSINYSSRSIVTISGYERINDSHEIIVDPMSHYLDGTYGKPFNELHNALEELVK